MTTVTVGRTLRAGEPVPGTGFELDPGGELAELLGERVGPLTSHPTRAAWAAPLVDDEELLRSVSVFGAGYAGPPEHYHLVSDEAFDVRRGALELTVDGETRRAAAGERVAVPTGARHTFRAVGDGLSVVVTDIAPPGRIGRVLPTLGGLAHDPEADAENPLQRAVIADRLARDTVFTETDPRLTRPLARLLAPLAGARGYRAAYSRYAEDGFWERHVEQPDL